MDKLSEIICFGCNNLREDTMPYISKNLTGSVSFKCNYCDMREAYKGVVKNSDLLKAFQEYIDERI